MAPVIFIQNNYVQANTLQVAKFAFENKIEMIDRSMTDTFDPDNCGVNWPQYGPVLVYGSVDFIKACAKSTHLAKYVFNDPAQFSMAAYVKHYKDLMLNARGKLTNPKELLETPSFTFTARYHIRPDSEDKAFPGNVYSYHEWVDLVCNLNLNLRLPCWVSPVAPKILREWRCWVVDGRVVSVVEYGVTGRLFSDPTQDAEAKKFAWRVCKPDMPANYYVMDICETTEGFKIVEFNPINSSGWYGSNTAQAVLAAWFNSMVYDAEGVEDGLNGDVWSV